MERFRTILDVYKEIESEFYNILYAGVQLGMLYRMLFKKSKI